MNKLTPVALGLKRDAVIVFGQQAQLDSAAVLSSASTIAADPAYSPAGRSDRIVAIVADARAAFNTALASITTTIEQVSALAADDLAAVTAVSDAEMAARSAVLGPVLMNAVANPSGLVRSYRRNFDRLVDRRLIEQTAEALMDTLADPVRHKFAEELAQAKRDLMPTIPDVEREAIEHVELCDEMGQYAGHVTRIVNVRLDQAALHDEKYPNRPRLRRSIQAGQFSNVWSEHFASTFERTGRLTIDAQQVRGPEEFIDS